MSIVNGHIAASRSAQQPAELAAMLCAFEVQTMSFAGKTTGECGATKPCLPSYYYSYRYLYHTGLSRCVRPLEVAYVRSELGLVPCAFPGWAIRMRSLAQPCP